MLPAPDDLVLPESDRRELILWAVACAGRLLPIFAAHRPDDPRLEAALEGARRFAVGEAGVGEMRKLAFGCHAAARDTAEESARAIARATGQAVAVAHMAGHAREIARYTRKALAGEALEAELAWQRDHLPPRFREYV